MIRTILPGFGFRSLFLITTFALAGAPTPSLAQVTVPTKPKTGSAMRVAAASAKAATKPDPKKTGSKKPATPDSSAAGKPLLVATYGDWGAYAAKVGSNKTCYALAQPKDREPSNLKRDPAYIFIADRPAENVHNEVSIIMGFDVRSSDDAPESGEKKDAAAVPEASAEVGTKKFILIAKGSNLWLKNAAEEGPMIAAMRKNGKLTVQAASLRGNVTTDDYSLKGLAQALDRAQKECQ